jgi:uncharacterized zinc-type alcohol dehydrogenase-like protein
MTQILAYATQSPSAPLDKFTLERREPGATDVQIEILYCGVCHRTCTRRAASGQATVYPCVPGHEIVGNVTAVGSAVKTFKVGDLAAVGCMVDSCGTCPNCRAGSSSLLRERLHPDLQQPGQTPAGQADLWRLLASRSWWTRDSAACAGALRGHPAVGAAALRGDHDLLAAAALGRRAGQEGGIVGLGGLGHMGVKFAHSVRGPDGAVHHLAGQGGRRQKLGADEVVISEGRRRQCRQHLGSFDVILNTVAASHNLDAYTKLLKRDGTLILVGAPEHPHPSPSVGPAAHAEPAIAGSMIGGIAETQEMLDFCAAHKIVSDVEVIPIQQINEAYERMLKSDVKYRFVIDMASLT